MKKLIVLFLLTTLMLTSCFGGGNDMPDDTMSGADTGDVHNNTLGDDNGDGMVEDETDDGTNGGLLEDIKDGAETMMDDIKDGVDNIMGGTVGDVTDTGTADTAEGDGMMPNFSTVDKVNSADDALNFIGANVYSKCQDVIPLLTETKILSTDEIDSISYNTGLASTDGIDDIIVSDSSLESFAYSLVMLRTDGTNTDELQTQVGQSINPEKWLGVVAEKVSTIKLDDDIIVVMGGAEQVDTIMNSVMEAANGVYENVGDIVSVLG